MYAVWRWAQPRCDVSDPGSGLDTEWCIAGSDWPETRAGRGLSGARASDGGRCLSGDDVVSMGTMKLGDAAGEAAR